MKVIVTGANGMVARAAIGYCRAIGDEVFGLTRQDLDISDHYAVAAVLDNIKPDAVLNCAAYTDVDGAETNEKTAINANTRGVRFLAEACKNNGSRFVTISTDYVFNGENSGFYTQRDTPDPKGIYAITKFGGEVAAQNVNARTIIVRTGWIYGEGGTNFLSVLGRLLADGKPIKAIGDSFGTPTFAGDLAKRLRELAGLDMPCIFHVTNSGPGASYLGFAEKVCKIGGFDPGLIEPVSKDDLRRPAPRPVSSKLACLFSEKFGLEPMPDWEDALERFLRGKDKSVK